MQYGALWCNVMQYKQIFHDLPATQGCHAKQHWGAGPKWIWYDLVMSPTEVTEIYHFASFLLPRLWKAAFAALESQIRSSQYLVHTDVLNMETSKALGISNLYKMPSHPCQVWWWILPIMSWSNCFMVNPSNNVTFQWSFDDILWDVFEYQNQPFQSPFHKVFCCFFSMICKFELNHLRQKLFLRLNFPIFSLMGFRQEEQPEDFIYTVHKFTYEYTVCTMPS